LFMARHAEQRRLGLQMLDQYERNDSTYSLAGKAILAGERYHDVSICISTYHLVVEVEVEGGK